MWSNNAKGTRIVVVGSFFFLPEPLRLPPWVGFFMSLPASDFMIQDFQWNKLQFHVYGQPLQTAKFQELSIYIPLSFCSYALQSFPDPLSCALPNRLFSYICVNSTRVAYRKISVRVIFFIGNLILSVPFLLPDKTRGPCRTGFLCSIRLLQQRSNQLCNQTVCFAGFG